MSTFSSCSKFFYYSRNEKVANLRPSGFALFEIDLAWSCLILAKRALFVKQDGISRRDEPPVVAGQY